MQFISTRSRDSGQELGTSRVQTLQSEESNYGAMNPKSPGLTSILGIGIGLRTSTVGICFLGKKGCIPLECYCLTTFEAEPQFGKNHSGISIPNVIIKSLHYFVSSGLPQSLNVSPSFAADHYSAPRSLGKRTAAAAVLMSAAAAAVSGSCAEWSCGFRSSPTMRSGPRPSGRSMHSFHPGYMTPKGNIFLKAQRGV